VFANPPYHAASGTVSPAEARNTAKRAGVGEVASWAAALGRRLRPGGTLTLILPPARLAEALAGAAEAGCGGVRLFPLWPKAGRAAKLMLVQAGRGSRAPLGLLPGLVLHREDGGFTDAAEGVLRGGDGLGV
jgi:tRNA1(Val) A37 N6-methylase TrmN6